MTFDPEGFRKGIEAAQKEAEDRIAKFDPHLDLHQFAGSTQAAVRTVSMLIPNIKAEAEHADDDR